MTYEFMRLLLFFDLPMVTKKDVRIYTRFRKYLIKQGYIMLQFSVYCKLFANREALVNHVEILKINVPANGQVRVMMVTERQYNKMQLLSGSITVQEKKVSADTFIKL